jgi:predicted Na+-dependent transporter
MGILLDPKILIELVKKPKAVLVGFISQYGLMPFLAMAIAKIFHYSPLYSLALFVIGCCPGKKTNVYRIFYLYKKIIFLGSGASNQWTLLFDGDVNLSAVMSFVSTASSFVMMPLYFYTLGRIYMDELNIRVPFLGLVRSLALVVIPYSTGILISHKSSRIRSIVKKLVKPMMLFLLLFFLVFGTCVNWYLFQTIDLYTALTAPLLPYLGFIFGALFAWICRLNWAHIKTIGIEAGIQNVGIAFMIIYYSFPQPYATKAIVVPLVVAFLTTKPFWVIYIIRNRIIKYKKSKELENNNGELILVDEKPSLNNEKEDNAEVMQKL